MISKAIVCKHCGEVIWIEKFMGKDFYIDATGGDECPAEEDSSGVLRERKHGMLAHEPDCDGSEKEN